MRRHRRFERLAPSFNAERFSELVRAEHLVAARLEPGHSGAYEGLLDLVFARDGGIALVPFVVVAALMLLERESSPFIWPAWLPPLRARVADEIEDEVEPWLLSLGVARFHSEETLRLFGEDRASHELVARARTLGLLGAAPTDVVLPDLAPYVYAQRFARGRSVAVLDPRGASGASVLARSAASVTADVGDGAHAAVAAQWFDLDIYDSHGQAPCDVFVGPREVAIQAATRIVLAEPCMGERSVHVARPLAPAITVSFDLADAAPVRTFGVAAADAVGSRSGLPDVPVVGGSSGRIGIVVREDFDRSADADVDAARAVAQRLRDQGFAPEVLPASRVRRENFDLLQVFGCEAAAALSRELTAAVPLVLCPYADDPAAEAAWGAQASMLVLRAASDVAGRSHYARAMSERKIAAPNVPQQGQPYREDALRAAMACARAAVVSTAEEERRIREHYGFAGATRVVAALLGAEPEPEPIGSLVGPDDFVLVHAPVEPRCNQLPIAAAAARLGFGLVLLGNVAHPEYYTELMAALGDGAIWLAEETLTAGEIGALYGRARVFADASWSARGLYRVARAAAFGASLVVPASGFGRSVWPGSATHVDPASSDAVLDGLNAAWRRAPDVRAATAARTAEACNPFNALVTTLGAYQEAAKQAV